MDFREYFLNRFDKYISTGIIEFCKSLSNTEADIFILMARKAACFIECLEELSLVKLNGIVTTDRILDMDLCWLKNKRIVVIDEAIVSGTTIYETINILKGANVKNIQVRVICINKDWFNEELLIDDETKISYLVEPYMKLKNEECIKLCSDIVSALSIFPRPYAVDFPLFNITRLSEKYFDEVCSNSFWSSDNISSILQKENDIYSITLSPHEIIAEKLNIKLGYPLSNKALIKIRIYGKLLSKGENESPDFYNLKILPLVVLKPIRTEEVEEIFNSIVLNSSNFSKEEIDSFISTQSKLRLIQHIAASYLAKIWFDNFPELTNTNIKLYSDNRYLGFLFPPKLSNSINNTLNEFKPIFKDAIFNPVELLSNLFNKDYKSDIKGNDLISLKAKLVEPFLKNFYEKELISRKLVKEYGKEVFQLPEYKSIIERLKNGFSLTYLQNILSDYTMSLDVNRIVSLFLDSSIDMGIVVPITGVKEGVFFRAYRHGEDVVFGEIEEKLCSLMLQTFCSSSGKVEIPHIWSEKLLVILIKIGVHKKFLDQIIYSDPPKEIKRIVSVKNYLFGQVANVKTIRPGINTFDPVYINEDQKSKWLTNILIDRKYLTINKANKFYIVNQMTYDEVAESKRLNAEEVGDLFGILYKNKHLKISPSLNELDLVTLTSCLNPNDIAASMAAEIFIFMNKWTNHKIFINRESKNNSKYYDISRSIRYKNIFWTAINSGQKKYREYVDKHGHSLIDSIANELTDRFQKRTWMHFWSTNAEWDKNTINKSLEELIFSQAVWLFKVNIYLRVLDLLFRRLMNVTGMEQEILIANEKSILEFHKELNNLQNKESFTKGKFDKQKNVLKKKIKDCKAITPDLQNGVSTILSELEEKRNQLDTYLKIKDGELIDYLDNIITSIYSFNDSELKDNINNSMRYIDEEHKYSKLILERVDLIINQYGKVETIIDYNYALYINYVPIGKVQFREIENIIYDEFEVFEKSINEPTTFYLLPNAKNIVGNSIWILGRRPFAKNRLISLASSIFQKISSKAKIRIILFPNLSSDFEVSIVSKNTSNIKFKYFWDRVIPIIDTNPIDMNDSSFLIIAHTDHTISPQQLFDDVIKESKAKFNMTDSSTFKNGMPINQEIYISKFELQEMTSSADIGIITILPPEARAIYDTLSDQKKEQGQKTGRIYYKGFLEGLGNTSHSVVMTQQLTQGNESVISAYRDIVEEFNPKLMILFGIAGSISNETKLCDVCIVNQTIDYDKRTEKNETHFKGNTYRISAKVLAYLNDFFFVHGEFPEFDASEGAFASKFKVAMGPIGSGNAVIGNPLSEIKKWLLNYNTKTIAVETESTGFCNVIYEEELTRLNERIGSLIIRGISDHADEEKDDKWRLQASKNAAIVLVEILKLLPRLNTLI